MFVEVMVTAYPIFSKRLRDCRTAPVLIPTKGADGGLFWLWGYVLAVEGEHPGDAVLVGEGA